MRNVMSLCALTLALFVSDRAFSQASFALRNYYPGAGLDAPVFDEGGHRLFGTDYVAMLYGGATSNSLSAAVDLFPLGRTAPPTPFTLLVDTQAGYFNYGTVLIPEVPGGLSAWLQVRAWDTCLGATYEDVVSLGNGGYGQSALFYTMGGDPFAGVPTPPGPLLGLQSFSLVPEPSTLLLLLLGVPAVVALRWRPHRSINGS